MLRNYIVLYFAATVTVIGTWVLLIEIREWHRNRQFRQEYAELVKFERAREATGGHS